MSELLLLDPLEPLFERPGLPESGLPRALARAYGGELGFESPRLFANFVASLDGVVALPTGGNSGQIISQDSQPDRFVMGLLRACADAVIVGAGTFRKSSTHLWRSDVIYPPAAALYAELRATLGLAPKPQLVLVSESGAIDPTAPAVADAWIATSPAGADSLRSRLPPGARLLLLEPAAGLGPLVSELHAAGYVRLLTEGGPTLFARLLRERLVDELFLTSSPALFGHPSDGRRKFLVEGLDVTGTSLELLSLRRHASHLFLRYALTRAAAADDATRGP
jgi:riboflavin biosynthesis pyrimidine reductase